MIFADEAFSHEWNVLLAILFTKLNVQHENESSSSYE